jgi:23S rRNA (cytidine1920-2'-O)/16S rRNA (cytidine1409-2'-O)-methyltransferase
MPPQKPARVRADLALVEQGLAPSREKARALILAGEVLAGDRPIDKAGDLVEATAELRLRSAPMPYVSRGGSLRRRRARAARLEDRV